MKVFILSGCILLGSVFAAQADCAAELAQLGGGIAKDGSLAPLQDTGSQNEIAKDGTDMPLGSSADVATSPADVEAQQQGGLTAAEEAMGGRSDAIAKARQAMTDGDEAACMEALKSIGPS